MSKCSVTTRDFKDLGESLI